MRIMEKRTKVDFCGDVMYLTQKGIQNYQQNVDMLIGLALKAGRPREEAESQIYLKILKDE